MFAQQGAEEQYLHCRPQRGAERGVWIVEPVVPQPGDEACCPQVTGIQKGTEDFAQSAMR